MFSLPYTIATTILREKLLPDMYSEEKIKSPEVQGLLKKIQCKPDPEADQLWYDNQWLVFNIEMMLKGGKQIKHRVEWPKEKPPFGKKEVEQKFRDLASLVVSPDRVEQIVQTVGNGDAQDGFPAEVDDHECHIPFPGSGDHQNRRCRKMREGTANGYIDKQQAEGGVLQFGAGFQIVKFGGQQYGGYGHGRRFCDQ